MDRFLDKPRVPAGSKWFFTSEVVQVSHGISSIGVSTVLHWETGLRSLENENLPDFTHFLVRRALNFLLISFVRMSKIQKIFTIRINVGGYQPKISANARSRQVTNDL